MEQESNMNKLCCETSKYQRLNALRILKIFKYQSILQIMSYYGAEDA
jgi:hypothetical protein